MQAPDFFDVVVVGAGAAGLFCAAQAGQKGLRVLLVDHSDKVAEKIRISGGGRANFTNLDVSPTNFISQNPHFCRSALARFTPQDFLVLMKQHGIAYHEKHKGQLFCDHSANDLIAMLLAECDKGGVTRWHGCAVKDVKAMEPNSNPLAPHARYTVQTARGHVNAHSLVVATGGLSIPKIGASDWGHRLARQFGLRIVPPQPALVPLTFDAQQWAPFVELAGASLPVEIATGSKKKRMQFSEDLLFTHRGLSGPAVLQISSYWTPGEALTINLCPGVDLAQALKDAKLRSKKLIANELAQWLPSRLADAWVGRNSAWQKSIADAQDKALLQLAEQLQRWSITPTGTEGYAKAEVTTGGVDTRDLSSQTLESKQAGLYFIGEVVDVTGWLGGYNFQWAWASGKACAEGLGTAMAK